jgi:hypothetical protein
LCPQGKDQKRNIQVGVLDAWYGHMPSSHSKSVHTEESLSAEDVTNFVIAFGAMTLSSHWTLFIFCDHVEV